MSEEETIKYRDAFPKDYDLPTYFTSKHAASMLLRDYFAAKALQGYISAKGWHPDFVFPTDFNFDDGKRASDAVAVSAYKWADAMLKAREA